MASECVYYITLELKEYKIWNIASRSAKSRHQYIYVAAGEAMKFEAAQCIILLLQGNGENRLSFC